DLSSHRPPPRERRLQLRLRSRRGQACPADQLLLPQPRRGDVRRVPAPDGRHRLQELPHDRARGSRGREDQVPVPL
ncbi:MAG: DNA-directed RNA polymerase omega subunit, partial [uncultured Solirubrobacteraceae bacterium]